MKFKHPALLLFIAGVVHCANAHAYTFDASMLGDAAKGVDMSLFNQGVQQPGTYRVDVMVNGKRVDTRDVVFKLEKDGQGTPVSGSLFDGQSAFTLRRKNGRLPSVVESSKAPR